MKRHPRAAHFDAYALVSSKVEIVDAAAGTASSYSSLYRKLASVVVCEFCVQAKKHHVTLPSVGDATRSA